MTTETEIDVRAVPPITRRTDAREVATAAYDALLDQLGRLDEAGWAAPTECAPWTVSDMVGHLIGAARSGASLREAGRQQLWGRRHRGEFAGNELDAVNALQVRDHADLTASARLGRLHELAPAAVDGRMRLPRPLRWVRVPMSQGGSTASGMPTSLTLAELVDVVYTRDVWLHRVDVARAAGAELVVDPALDRRVVADVVREWAGRHGRPFRLELTGAAGGRFRSGDDGPQLELDAVEFCRALSGRAPGEGLLAMRVLF
ncbi:TIGR03084 family metal-binding protein [Angustibacter peucedani]